MASTHKEERHVNLGARYIFEPTAVETLGVFNASARHLLEKENFCKLRRGLRDQFLSQRSSFWCSASMPSFCTTVCQP